MIGTGRSGRRYFRPGLSRFRTLDAAVALLLGAGRFRLSTPENRYDTEETLRFFSELEDRLAALPSVQAAAIHPWSALREE